MAALSFIGFLFPLLFLGIIILVISALVGARGEPDLTGRRPYAIFLSLVTFIGLFMTLGALFALLKAFFDMVFVGSEGFACPEGFVECGGPGMGGFGSESNGREALGAAIVALASGALTYISGQKVLELRALEPGTSSSSARTLQVFGYAVSFAAVFGALSAVVAGASALVDIADPPFGATGGRDQAISTLLTSIVIAALLVVLFRYTWNRFDLGLKLTNQTPSPPAPPSPGI